MNATRTSACRSNGRLPGTGTHRRRRPRPCPRAGATTLFAQRIQEPGPRLWTTVPGGGPGGSLAQSHPAAGAEGAATGRKRTCTQPVEKPVDHMWGLARDEQSMSEADLAEMHIEPAQREWLQLTRPLGLVENTALIATPNEFVKEQLETRLRSLITNALSRELGRSIQLAVTVDPAVISAMPLAGGHQHPMPAMPADAEPGGARDHRMPELDHDRLPARHRQPVTEPGDDILGPPRGLRIDDTRAGEHEMLGDGVDPVTGRPRHPAIPGQPAPGHGAPRPGQARLNPKYTFETFVIGSSNRFAHAAAVAVAEAPAKAYNPLFVYGDSGLGKTHLLHAIGHYAQSLYPGVRVRYVSSEEFTNDFINMIRDGKQDGFRRRYRDVDVLLVDDIQFLENKEGTQEEFFHTFNTLHNASKQIVISSDRAPKRLVTLEDRLRSRFEWGLLTDV